MIEKTFNRLVGLRLFKSWNVFATRMFYFAVPALGNPEDDGDFRLTLECPWRIEQQGRILVGSEDYGLRADDNTNPDWDPSEMQWGHLQDQKLEKILGQARDGAVFNTSTNLVVEAVSADTVGGFQLHLSGGYVLAAFPTSDSDMEWLLSPRGGGSLALMNGTISGTLATS